jgi:hypothetical protein
LALSCAGLPEADAREFEWIDRSAAELTAESSTTEFSGNGPAESTLSKDISYNAAMVGVEWGEDTDDPCYLKANYRDVATDATETSRTFDRCDGHNPGNMKYVGLPFDHFVTGVKVCKNRDGDKIKGIKLYGQPTECRLGADSVYRESGGSVFLPGPIEYTLHNDSEIVEVACGSATEVSYSAEHTNCDHWGTRRDCPTGMVATGMKFGLEDGSGDREMIEGIALLCHTVTSD